MKRFWLGSLAVFLVIFATDFLIHGVLLKNIYMQTAPVWRPEEQMKKVMWFMWLSYIITSLIFTFIYVKGYEPDKINLPQGFRYGTLFGLLMGSSFSLCCYVILPIPGMLAIYWFVLGMIQAIIAGLAVSSIYRKV